MARWSFGKSEDLKCLEGIEKFEITAAEGEVEVCYAAKISTQNIILPVGVKVDSYVLASDPIVGTFYSLEKEDITYYQIIGNLPDPLPKYELENAVENYVKNYL